MKTNEFASVAVAVVILAGLAVTVANGGNAAKVLDSGFGGFANVIKAAAYGK